MLIPLPHSRWSISPFLSNEAVPTPGESCIRHILNFFKISSDAVITSSVIFDLLISFKAIYISN